MRQGSNNGRRPRGRTNRKQHGGGPSRPHTYDSNGPDGRVRGNARQVYEKYLTLARDAQSAGDRIAAEAYFQHAEHYFRILSDSTDPQRPERRPDARTDARTDARADSRAAAAGEGAAVAHVNGEAEETAGGESLVVEQPADAQAVEVAAEHGDQHHNGSDGAQNGQNAETLIVPAAAQSEQEEAAPKPAPKRRGRPRKARSGDQEDVGAKDSASKDSAPKDGAPKERAPKERASKDSTTKEGAPSEAESDPASA
ncbi:DUF4167 domain-containing protein [Pelagibius sp.]|uniref:DUF4167 domain-containing protein n=1 Tax=Pelagibius sp. TaxID=1931238 RepID=UPI003B512045